MTNITGRYIIIPTKENTMSNRICKRCGYDWVSRLKDKIPRMCPKCKSRYWNSDEIRKPGPKKRYQDGKV